MGTVIVQTICVLAGVCALAVVSLRWLGARLGNQGTEAPMRVVGRLPLEPRRALLVVKVGERTVMLASSEAGVHPVGELGPDEAAALERSLQEQRAPSVSRETLLLGRGA